MGCKDAVCHSLRMIQTGQPQTQVEALAHTSALMAEAADFFGDIQL